MRNLRGMCVGLVLCISTVSSLAVDLALDDFDTLDAAGEFGWIENTWNASDAAYVTITGNRDNGDTWLRIEGDASTPTTAYATRKVDLSQVTDPALTIQYSLDWQTPGCEYSVQVSNDGSSYATMLTSVGADPDMDDGDSNVSKMVYINSYFDPSDDLSEVSIRFSGTGVEDDDIFEVFGVAITGSAGSSIAEVSGAGGDGSYIAQDTFGDYGSDVEYGWLEDDWTEQDRPDFVVVDETKGAPDSDSPSVRFKSGLYGLPNPREASIERSLDLSEYSSVKVHFYYRHKEGDGIAPGVQSVEVYDEDNGVWYELWGLAIKWEDIWVEESVILGDAYTTSSTTLRLRSRTNAVARCWFDDIRVESWETAAPTSLDLDSTSDSGDSNTDNVTNITTDLEFTVEGLIDGAAVTVYDNDVSQTVSMTTSPDGTIGYFTLDLAEGAHVITVRQEDTSLDMGLSDPISLTVTVDTTAPGIGWINGDDPTTGDTTPSMGGFCGTGSPSTVRLYEGTTLLAVTDVFLDNFYVVDDDWQPGVSLTAGAHDLYVKAVDVAGNVGGASGTLEVTVDLTPPLVSTVVINDGDAQRNSIDTIAYTFSEYTSVASDDLSIYRYDEAQSSWVAVSLTGATYFNKSWDISGLLTANGHYVAILSDDVVDSPAGNALDGDGDQVAGGDHVFGFHLLAGDFDGNAAQESADVDELWAAMGGADTAFDLDGDDDVDSADADELVYNIMGDVYPGAEYGDFDWDGDVDTADSNILSANFGQGTIWAEGDCDGDADVDTADFVIMKNNMATYNANFDPITLGTAPTYP